VLYICRILLGDIKEARSSAARQLDQNCFSFRGHFYKNN
jgi:hypothetical protein